MCYETFVAVLAIVLLCVGVVAVYMGEYQGSFYTNKGKLCEICSVVSVFWFLPPFFSHCEAWVFLITIPVALVFIYFSFRYKRMADELE